VDEIGISSDGALLGLGFYNGGIALWDTKQKKVISKFETDKKSARQLQFSGDNTYLLVSLVDSDYSYGALYIWNIKTGNIHDKLTSFHDLVPFDVSPDGKEVIFATKTGDLVLMEIESKKIIKTLSTKEEFARVYYSPNGQNIVASVGHKKIKVWNLPSEEITCDEVLDDIKIDGELYTSYYFSNPIDDQLIGMILGSKHSRKEKLLIYGVGEKKIHAIYPLIKEGEGGEGWYIRASKNGSIIACYILGGYIRAWMDLDWFLKAFF